MSIAINVELNYSVKENIVYLKLLWKYLKKDKRRILCYLLLSFLSIITVILGPYVLGLALESLISLKLNSFIILILTNALVNVVGYVLMACYMEKLYFEIEKNAINSIVKDLYNKVNSLPAIAFEEMGVGEFTNRMYSDPNTIIDLAFSFLRGILNLFRALIIFIIVFNISIIIGIQLIAFVVTMYILTNVFIPEIKKSQEKVSFLGDDYLKTNTEYLSASREIKSLGIKNILAKKVFKGIEDYTSSNKRVKLYETYYQSFNNGVFYMFQILLFITMGYMYINGYMPLAYYIAIQTYIFSLDYAVSGISDMGVSYSKIVVSLKRLEEILNNKLYSDEKFGTKSLSNIEGVITFKDVNFKYKEDEDFVLNNLNLVFKPNVKNAIIGKSGNGKSTIFNLLLRYFDASEGNVYIDNENIKSLTEKSLRKNVSIIRQQPFIFNETIKENFKMVKPNVTNEEIIEVCKKAYIHDYIVSLKRGYDTQIGEGGVNLSGGQKQRLAIARTLLLDTKIILFDEATSALDNEAQKYIKKTIDNLVKSHTVIIVAHRLSTIVDSDKIYVIDKGTLVASGSHETLLKDNDIYKNLYSNEDLLK